MRLTFEESSRLALKALAQFCATTGSLSVEQYRIAGGMNIERKVWRFEVFRVSDLHRLREQIRTKMKVGDILEANKLHQRYLELTGIANIDGQRTQDQVVGLVEVNDESGEVQVIELRAD